jgi:hypothetical protein
MKSWNLTKAVQAGMMASAAMSHAKFENTANRDVRNRRGLARKMRHIARNMVPKK